jgi:hypothetical protein
MAIEVEKRASSSGNSFTTFQTPAGTSPVADSSSDVLTFTSSDGSVTITGNASTDTIDLVAVASGGGASYPSAPVTKAVTATLTATQMRVIANSASAINLTLPAASACKEVVIKNIGAGLATAVPAGSDTAETALELGQYTALWLMSDNVSKWWIV